jgi:hypothetical protein
MTAPDQKYLSAMVEFLDRGSGEVKKAMLYPIISITLFQRMDAENPSGKPERRFVPAEDGSAWAEVQ